jgi:protoporphyrinogen oxidase
MVKHYYIIGAGVSGLTAGLELLRKGASVTVIESTSKVGGLAASIKYDDYVIDYGPHLFHSAHPEIIEYWRELVGEKLVSKDFYSGNYKNKNIYDYPINLETAKDQYSKKEFELMIFCSF